MKHTLPASLLAIALAVAPAIGQTSPLPTADDLAQTARTVAALQNKDGGFSAKAGQPSTLGDTSAAIRVLGFVGGSIPDVLGAIDFVKKCQSPDGGFAPTPGGQVSPGTTATGLMVSRELKILDDAMIASAIKVFSRDARSFEEVRIAIAGMEAAGKPSPDFDRWTTQILEGRKPDGTWGEGDARAFETGGRIAALLRMGKKPEQVDEAARVMLAGQQPDGAFTTGTGGSDLSASYRITRGLFMLDRAPDLDKLRAYIARCRRSDGTYAPKPDAPDGSLGATYMATILLHWANRLEGRPALLETAGFQPLFNGRDLEGWEGDKTLFSVRDGMIVGKSPGIDKNQFLATTETYGDFILQLSFRLIGDEKSNSGIQFRSERLPGHEMIGYQADIGAGYWGCLYDESRRNRVLARPDDNALSAINKDGWNHYVVRAIGNSIRLTLNGRPMAVYTEEDPSVATRGHIALQIHSGGPMEIQFKDILIQPLPTPTPSEGDPVTSGFFRREFNAADGKRAYTVFVPKGYDGSKTYPAALFLHGAGERGSDGVVSAQVGLGPIVATKPEAFPFVIVFPQARETWAGGSADSEAALAALDDAAKHIKIDLDRVVLTGLSMGGRGTWDLAARHPDRFRGVAAICGRGTLNDAATLKALPAWTFCGDEDGLQTVQNGRDMTRALLEAGGNARLTEYRSVGHNSWDRAYSDPELAAWFQKLTADNK